MNYREHRTSTGLAVIAEENPDAQSVAIGFFVRAGSRDESPEIAGVSHFLEHMAFKGRGELTADDVNRIFDEIGAKYNAATSEETTLFYAGILPEYMDRAFPLLAALIQPDLRQEDFDVEKNVILEEISMYDDMPAFVAYDNVMQRHFRGHALSQSILGTHESITALTADQMRAYHRQRYQTESIVLAVAGALDFDHIVELAERHCGEIPAGRPRRLVAEPKPEPNEHWILREQMLQQTVAQLAAAPAAASPLRFAAELLSVIVGDDSGSKLYWELVDTGLAESAEVAFNDYDGCGSWMTYLACRPEETAANLERIAGIFDSVNRDGVTETELEQAKNKVASRLVLRSERPMGRLSSLGSNWLYLDGAYRSVEDDLESIRSVTTADIQQLLADYPLAQTTTVGIGPLVPHPA